MRPLCLTLVILSLMVAGLPARAASSSADAPHVRVELLVPQDNLFSGNNLNDVGLYFKLEPGWHIYWKNPGDAGLPPHVSWTLPAGITADPMQFPAPKRLPLGPLMDFGYENEVLFPLKLHVADGVKEGPVSLHVKVDWLVCQASCIPGKAELEVQRKVYVGLLSLMSEKDQTLGWRFFGKDSRLLPQIPEPLPGNDKTSFQSTTDGFRLSIETARRESSAVFFPSDPDILDNPASQKFTATANGLTLDFKKDANLTATPKELKGVLELSGGRNYEIVALPPGVKAATPSAAGDQSSGEAASEAKAPDFQSPTTSGPGSTQSVSAVAISPYGAGIPEHGHTTTLLKLLRISGLAFLGGLLLNLMPCVFPVLFLKGLALVHTGHRELHRLRAHGLVYAAGILASFWVLVGVLLGLRAGGATLGWGFQFQSPVFLALMAGLLFFLGLSLAGQFEIGLTLTSTGGSLAEKQGYTGSFFTGVLAVVVATPCTAPFMGAAIGYALAQSAAVTFAVFTALALGLAAPYVALTLQPAWTRLLPKPGAWMEVLRQAVAVPIFATVIWLAWVLAQAYGAGVMAALLASFLLLAIAGWFLGRWPARRWSAAVAGLILLAVAGVSVYASNRLVIASETLAKDQGQWERWSAEAVNRYQAQGRPVLVDFTASWCLSCQVNERAALDQPEVKQALQSANVALLRADWTRHDEAITQALTALGRSGVPAYALYTPGQSQPQMLPEVLTPGIVTEAVESLPKTAR
ncbi:MAG: thioredoxin family protein [Terracidiphilus sp.]|jgi:thiol:disulfide interchange protein DsbD